MKKLQLLTLFLFLYQFGFSQSACNNKIKVEQLLKQEGSKNYGDRYNALERAKFYWWRRCQCESGQVSDPAGEQTIIKYLATGYDNFIPYKGKFNDIPEPNKRDFKVGECYTGSEPNVSISYGLDCTPVAKSFLQSAKDPQQYGKAFFAAYCECETGAVNSEERAKQLEATMVENHKNYHAYKTNEEPSITIIPLKASQCLANSDKSNSGETYTDPKVGVIVKDEYLDLLNDIAADSKNPNFKTMVEGMNRNKEIVGKVRSFAIQTGTMKQGDADYYNNLENIAQGVEVVKFIYNSFSSKEAPLSPEQLKGREIIQNNYWELKDIYNEVKAVPTFYSYDEATLQRLESIKNRIPEYENATATRRLLYLVYWNSKPYITYNELVAKFDEIESLKTAYGVEHIKQLISKYQSSYINNKAFSHIVDKENGFKITNNKLALEMAKYYKANGNSKKSSQILKSLNYDVDNFDSFKLLYNAYSEKNYYGSILYYEQVKEILIVNEQGGKFFYFYGNIPNLDYNVDGLKREEASYLICLGVLSYLKSGELTQAENELEFLKRYNDNFKQYLTKRKGMSIRKKASGYSDTELESSYNLCIALEKTIEATLLSKKGENKNAQTLIDEAILLNEENHSVNDIYKSWLLLSQLDISIRTGSLIQAKKTAIKLKHISGIANTLNYRQYSQEEFQFLLSFLKYKEGNLESALNSLELLEIDYPNSIRIQQLKNDINIQLNKNH